MTTKVWPLAESSWTEQEYAAARRVLDSGRITYGEEVRGFEQEFAAYLGVRYAVMTNSGSSANLLAIATLSNLLSGKRRPLRPGDAVLVPGLAWATTYAPLSQYGLHLRVLDINLETLNVDFKDYLSSGSDPKLIVAVSILGNPCEALPQLREFCDARRIFLLEDNCESLGAEIALVAFGSNPTIPFLKWKRTGTFGHISTHSFFFSHQISTGEGGMLATDDRTLADLARCLRAHGWARDLEPDSPLLDPHHFGSGDSDFAEAYRFLLPGYNLRPSEIAAAVGRVQLQRLDSQVEARRANALQFREAFADDPRFILQRETGRSSWFGFTMILRDRWATPENRSRAFTAMRAAGIEFRPITGGSFARHPSASAYNWIHTFSWKGNVNTAHDYGWFVGNHARPLNKEINLLREVLSNVKLAVGC